MSDDKVIDLTKEREMRDLMVVIDKALNGPPIENNIKLHRVLAVKFSAHMRPGGMDRDNVCISFVDSESTENEGHLGLLSLHFDQWEELKTLVDREFEVGSALIRKIRAEMAAG